MEGFHMSDGISFAHQKKCRVYFIWACPLGNPLIMIVFLLVSSS